MKVYKVAIIGCGQMGNAHAEQIYFKSNVKITYACDIDIEKAKLFALKYNAEKTVTNPEECISNEDTDIVIIATYPSAHLELL